MLNPFGPGTYNGHNLAMKWKGRGDGTMRSLFVVVTCLASTALCWAESCSENAAKRRAEIEADFLEGFFPDNRVLRGDQATESNVRTVERPLILHMATHGFFGEAHNERDNPMFRSGLHLADIEQVQVDRERDDGQLTAYEVSGMDLRGTQLVVLSACDTGMGGAVMAEGKELMSEGVSGLRRAFAVGLQHADVGHRARRQVAQAHLEAVQLPLLVPKP